MFIFLYLYHFLFDNYTEGVIKGMTSSAFRRLWMVYEEPSPIHRIYGFATHNLLSHVW